MRYHVEVGGFVTVYRRRTLVVHADTQEEAEQKAIDGFVDLQNAGSGSPICEEGIVNFIEPLE